MQQDKKVCVIGLGYIGLPTAALLAKEGYSVHGVDTNQQVVDTINQGKIHIVEPELDTFVDSAVDSGNLRAATEPVEADIFMICVPTPFLKNDNSIPQPDLSYIEEATKNIAPYVRSGNIIILESTSPVGTVELVRDVLKQSNSDISSIHLLKST